MMVTQPKDIRRPVKAQNRPRILILAHLPPPIHGVTVINDTIVKSQLLGERFKLDVVPMRFASDFADIGSFRLSKILAMAGVALTLVHRFIFRRPDAVYMTPTPTGMSFIRDAMFASIMNFFFVRKIFHLHGQGVQRFYRNSRFYRLLYRWVFWRAQVIHLSDRLARELDGIVPAPRVHAVPNGIPAPPAVDTEKSDASDSGLPTLLYLSNITQLKGTFVLIDALVRLAADGLAFEVRFAGAPSDAETMRRFETAIAEPTLRDRTRYMGIVTGDMKDRLFREADIFVMPTLFDAFPLVALEAMAYGLPIVASEEGSLPDIIRDDETGILIEKGNARALADALRVLLVNAARRERMGAAGRRRYLAKFTFGHMETNLAQVIDRCLAYWRGERED